MVGKQETYLLKLDKTTLKTIIWGITQNQIQEWFYDISRIVGYSMPNFVFIHTHTHTHTYIYIYICVCTYVLNIWLVNE